MAQSNLVPRKSAVVTPTLLPVVYEEACRAIEACVELDELQTWASKAEALAAWAKIYDDNRILRHAKQLKLRAYRRMGQLADELRPKDVHAPRGRRAGAIGSFSLLREHGLNRDKAQSAIALGRLPPEKFDKFLNRKNVPSPTVARAFTQHSNMEERGKRSQAYSLLTASGPSPTSFRWWCQTHTPKSIAGNILPGERQKAHELVSDIELWCKTFLMELAYKQDSIG